MPFGAVTLRPGLNVELTETANEAGYSATNLVRFQAGLAQKIGGWQKFYTLPVTGIPRDLHAWQDLNETGYLAVGSTQQLAVISSDNLSDITPQTRVSDFAPNFTTTSGSDSVLIDDPNIANVTVFDNVFFNTPVSVGGLVLSAFFRLPSLLVRRRTTSLRQARQLRLNQALERFRPSQRQSEAQPLRSKSLRMGCPLGIE